MKRLGCCHRGENARSGRERRAHRRPSDGAGETPDDSHPRCRFLHSAVSLCIHCGVGFRSCWRCRRRGQSTPAKIPNEAKNANDVTSYKPTVAQFLQQTADQLANGTADQQSKAREALKGEALVDGQNKATAAYLNLYAQLLNEQLITLSQNSDMRVRLNAAIVDLSVAQTVNNAQLAPATAAFIGDKTDAVVLWGVKAARWVIPAQLGAFGGKTQLLDAIVAGVQAHPSGYTGGAIAYDAYLALTLDISPPLNKPTGAMMAAVVPAVQKLMELRKQQYLNGIAPSPRAEAYGSSFLSNRLIWTTLPAAQQVALMQDFCDLIGLMAQQAAVANPADLGELATTIAKISSAISVVVDPAGGPIAQKIAPATTLSGRSGVPAIINDVAAVLAAVKTVAQFNNLAAAPIAGGHNAAPPPASAPTTGPITVPGAIPMPPPPPPAAPTTRPRPAPTPTPTPTPTPSGNTNTRPRTNNKAPGYGR